MAVHWPELGGIVPPPPQRRPPNGSGLASWLPSDPIGSIRSSIDPVISRDLRAIGHLADRFGDSASQMLATSGRLSIDPMSFYGGQWPAPPLPLDARKRYAVPYGHPAEDAVKPLAARLVADGHRHQPKHPTK
jgi:hypothetical protein